MESSTIITVVIVAFILWILFFKEINPSNKTDAQLKWMYNKALQSWHPSRKNHELELLTAEMNKRGLLDNITTNSNKNNISTSEQIKINEAINHFEASGMQDEMQRMFASGIPEKIYNKTLEIAKIKGIPESEASSYFNEILEATSLKYKNMGLEQNEADEKALNDTLEIEVKNA